MKFSIRGYLIWFIITLFVVYAFFLNTAGSVFSETFKTTLKLSDIEASLAIGSFILGFACMQIPAGYLLDRFSVRYIVSLGIFLLAFGNLLLTLSSTLPLFALSNFMQGLGASFAFIAAGKLIGAWFAPHYFPILFGLTQTISCISTAIIHYYLVKALQTVSWQTIYLQFALLGGILLVITFLFVTSPNKAKATKTLSFKESLSLVLRNPQLWLCSLAAATSFGVLAAYGSFWYLSVQKHFFVDLQSSLVISGMVFVGIGIGTPFFGWLSNKFYSRKLIIHASVVFGTIFLILGLYLPHYNINNYIPINIISFFIGFFLSGSMLYYTCVSEISSDSIRAIALGLINTCVFVLNTLLLFIPQLFTPKASSTHFISLWVLPVVLLLSIFLSYFIKETIKGSQ